MIDDIANGTIVTCQAQSIQKSLYNYLSISGMPVIITHSIICMYVVYYQSVETQVSCYKEVYLSSSLRMVQQYCDIFL